MTCENAENKASYLYLSPFTQAMTLRLSPFSREAESNPNKAKADNHVPSADTRDWITSLGHIEDDDPEEADKKGGNHRRSEPARALKLERIGLGREEVRTVIFLLLADARLWHGGRLHQSSR